VHTAGKRTSLLAMNVKMANVVRRGRSCINVC
jgi:hypothetical protein